MTAPVPVHVFVKAAVPLARPGDPELSEVPGLAYFDAAQPRSETLRGLTALDQMYAYFGSDRAEAG